MKNIDAEGHVRGESIYLDDIPVRQGTLYGAVFSSPIAAGHIKHLDFSEALNAPGVVGILSASDVPGENQIGGIIPDEPLFAEREVDFQGQPICLILAESDTFARAALEQVVIEIEPTPIITDPCDARAKGMLIVPPRTFQLGDVEGTWSQCAHVISGQAHSGGQEHLYIETQGAYAYPCENGHLRIHSSTQGPTAVQRTVAKVLGVPMHQVEVDVTRLGGGFGGKEDQATPWAVMVALAAHVFRRPAKLVLHRMDDMRMTGKRHPYQSNFKIGLDDALNILAYQVEFHQNAGAAADLSPAVLERTLFHCTNSYFIPHVHATAYSCRTNLPPNTAFRGFGGPQGMFVLEAAICQAAEVIGVSPQLIQAQNLLKEGSEFPYGQKTKDCLARACWDALHKRQNIHNHIATIQTFNQTHTRFKKGLALMPVCFGISFTKTHMNQAGALVHIYQDGSVGLSTGAVEMGQGVNTKMLQVVSHYFGLPQQRIKLETTNTTRVANTSPTAASAGADLNGKATEKACKALARRLIELAASLLNVEAETLSLQNGIVAIDGEPSSLEWNQLVATAYLQRISLSQHAHYQTPGLNFDSEREKGEPFAYHVYGSAAFVAKVDTILGTYDIEKVCLVHDAGKSMNLSVDTGQIEGGLAQGIGWMTMEDVVYDKNGKLLSNALSTYKVPDIYATPAQVEVDFLNAPGSDKALLKSKAVGEPPLMYGIGAFFAIRNAILAANPNASVPFDAPITPEKVFLALNSSSEAPFTLQAAPSTTHA